MSEDPRFTDAALAAAFAGQPLTAPGAACPPVERIWSAAQGELSAADVETLADHAATCADCSAIWRAARECAPPRSAVVVTHPSWWTRVQPLALAASLVLAVGLGVWSVRLQQQNEALRASLEGRSEADRQLAAAVAAQRSAEDRVSQLSGDLARATQPVVNLPLFELTADITRSEETTRTLEPPKEATHLGLVLAATVTPPREGLRLEIRTTGGALAWSAEGLRPSEFGTFTAVVPRASVPDGRYRLVLVRSDVSPARTVQQFPLEIRSR